VARINIDVVERLAKHAAMRFIVPGDGEWPSELMIFDMPRASSGAVTSRWSMATRLASPKPAKVFL
jgi:hypothetical protein